ncbi:MAG TPA: hypothetical protein VGE74_16500 [Gemmata sp.]
MSRDRPDPKPAPRRLRRLLKWGSLAFALVGLVAFGVFWWFTCGPGSLYWQLAEYQEPYRKKADQWNAVTNRLPPLGSVDRDECRPGLNPVPRYSRQRGDGNCEITLRTNEFDQTFADWRQAPTFFTMQLESGLGDSLKWYTKPGIDIFKWSWGHPARPEVEKRLKLGLEQVYLVVVRPRVYEPIVEVGNGFKGGSLEIEGFIIDLRTSERLGQFAFAVRPPANLPVRRSRSLNNESDAVASGREAMADAAVSRLMEKLGQLTGGEFER